MAVGGLGDDRVNGNGLNWAAAHSRRGLAHELPQVLQLLVPSLLFLVVVRLLLFMLQPPLRSLRADAIQLRLNQRPFRFLLLSMLSCFFRQLPLGFDFCPQAGDGFFRN